MLLDLPTELVVQILAHLSINDLFSCRLACKYLLSVVRDNVALQYRMALIGTKATDNPCSTLPLSTKLEQLKNAEKAWAVLKPSFTTTIPVKHDPSGIYDLTGGVYLLGDRNRRDLYYVRLPNHPGERPEWHTIKVGRTIIDMGLCVYEHDLIAVVTTTPVTGVAESYDIELVLYEFSSSKPHPQAQKHVIHVMNSPWERPAIGIEIVGDNLVLILFHHRNNANPNDRVFVYEWRTGVAKMNFSVPHDTYTGLLFLDEHTILLPNTQTNALDIYHIPSKPSLDTNPMMSLSLPRLAESRSVGGISCRAEPNPIGASSYINKKKEAKEREREAALEEGQEEDMFPKRGYLADAEQAICIFALRVQGLQVGDFHFGHTFTFIVPRKALLDAVDAFVEEHGLKRANRPPSETDSTSTPSVPWADWGPQVTRWFNSDSIPTRWITTTAGQRCVLIADSAPDTGFPYVVLDFNPDSVRRMKRWLQARKERDKERERRDRERSRERAVEDAREWAETLNTHEQEEDDMNEGEDGDEEWYGSAVHNDIEDDSQMEYHTGLAIVNQDDYLTPTDDGPLISWEDVSGDDGASTSSPIASTSGAGGHVEIEDVADEENTSGSSNGFANGHAHHDEDSIELDHQSIGMDLDVNTSDDDATLPPDDAQSTANNESEHPDLEHDPNNPLEGHDNTAARRIWCVTSSEMVEPAETFAEHVEGRLPYVACASAKTYAFHGVLLDEERVIGIRTDFLDRIRQIEVHHFG